MTAVGRNFLTPPHFDGINSFMLEKKIMNVKCVARNLQIEALVKDTKSLTTMRAKYLVVFVGRNSVETLIWRSTEPVFITKI